MRDHGVGSNFARELRELGQTLTVEGARESEGSRVSTDFVRELASLGYRNLPLETLVRLRDHGVTPSFVSELKTTRPTISSTSRISSASKTMASRPTRSGVRTIGREPGCRWT